MAVARADARVRLARGVVDRLDRARAVVERLATSGRPIYGLTTGLGAAVDTGLAADDVAAFQARVAMGRAVGVGDYLSQEEVRATLFVRLAGIARGASGLAPAFAHAIQHLLDKRVHPRARRIGTLGEADLSVLAELFLPFAGGGQAEWRGQVLDGPEALRQAGIEFPAFGPKDGIALVNANAFSTGLAALTLCDADLALEAMDAAGALSLEGFRANLSPLDPRLVALRPAPGQGRGAERLRALLGGSDLNEAGTARRVQDPLSLRCLAPVHGAALDRLDWARAAVEADLNGAGDSPAVLAQEGLAEDDDMLSSANFDSTAMALSFENLGLSLSYAAALAASRITKLMSPAFADLPRFLTRHGGGRAGFATAGKTASALEAEIRHLALPLGGMAAPVADGAEDYAPMTPRIVEKTRDIVRRLRLLAAIELVVAAQAVELRGTVRLGQGTGAAYAFVRTRVAFLDEDRPTGRDFERVAAAIAAGDLRDALRSSSLA